MIKVKNIEGDEIKTSFIETPDVEYTKRGLLSVHIQKSYDNKTYEYETTFGINVNKGESTNEQSD